MKNVKVIVEKHTDGYVAYPVGMEGAIVAQGDSYDEVLANVKSAIAFHVETFGGEVLEDRDDVIEVFVAEATIPA